MIHARGVLAAVLPLLVVLATMGATPLDAASDETVYVTKTGAKYHAAGCSSLRRSSIPMKLSEAATRYGACRLCSPSVPAGAASGPATQGLGLTVKQPARQSAPATSGRCQATTKKGTQCSRSAQGGRSYCWQH